MRRPRHLYLIVFLFLFACSGAPGPTPTPLVPPQRSPVELPPTWTLTVTSVPSQTPIRTPTQTFTPFPSATPLPATWTSSPTSDAPTPTATPTITPTVDTSCYVFALEEGVPIQTAPFIDPYRVLPTMSPTVRYQATGLYPTYYELALDDEPVGWVDYRLLTLASQGPGCHQLPTDTRELTDFPSLCFFVANGEVQTYTDRALSKPYHTISSPTPYVLLLRYTGVFFTSVSEAGPSFFVDADQVSTFGACDNIPHAGFTTAPGWLWSQPDSEMGVQLESLSSRHRIYIQNGPVKGVKPPNISQDGAWYFVLVNPKKESLSGWIWSSLIILD